MQWTCHEQCWGAALVVGFDVSAALVEQHVGNTRVPFLRRHLQRGPARAVDGLNVGAPSKQELDGPGVPAVRGHVEGAAAVDVLGFHAGTRVQQEGCCLGVAEARSQKQGGLGARVCARVHQQRAQPGRCGRQQQASDRCLPESGGQVDPRAGACAGSGREGSRESAAEPGRDQSPPTVTVHTERISESPVGS